MFWESHTAARSINAAPIICPSFTQLLHVELLSAELHQMNSGPDNSTFEILIEQRQDISFFLNES
jgi:hypothetical protein